MYIFCIYRVLFCAFANAIFKKTIQIKLSNNISLKFLLRKMAWRLLLSVQRNVLLWKIEYQRSVLEGNYWGIYYTVLPEIQFHLWMKEHLNIPSHPNSFPEYTEITFSFILEKNRKLWLSDQSQKSFTADESDIKRNSWNKVTVQTKSNPMRSCFLGSFKLPYN